MMLQNVGLEGGNHFHLGLDWKGVIIVFIVFISTVVCRSTYDQLAIIYFGNWCRFRRKWAREQLNYYRGRMSPPTPPKPLEGKPDEVAAALVGWMEDVHAFSPSAVPDLATQQGADARQFLPMVSSLNACHVKKVNDDWTLSQITYLFTIITAITM
jgi:hypothetical protein